MTSISNSLSTNKFPTDKDFRLSHIKFANLLYIVYPNLSFRIIYIFSDTLFHAPYVPQTWWTTSNYVEERVKKINRHFSLSPKIVFPSVHKSLHISSSPCSASHMHDVSSTLPAFSLCGVSFLLHKYYFASVAGISRTPQKLFLFRFFFYYMLEVLPPPAKQPPIDGKKYAFRCSSAQVYSHFFIIFILRVLYGETRTIESAAAAVVQALRDGNDEKRDLSVKEIWMCVCCVGNKKKIFFSHSFFCAIPAVSSLINLPSFFSHLPYLSESKLPCTRCCLQSADAERIFGAIEIKLFFRKNIIFSIWKEIIFCNGMLLKSTNFLSKCCYLQNFKAIFLFFINEKWWMIDDEWEMRHFLEISFLSFIFSLRCLRYEQWALEVSTWLNSSSKTSFFIISIFWHGF